MPNIGATNVTHTVRDKQRLRNRYIVHAQISFGNTVLTYPSGGIPLTKAQLSLPENIDSLKVLESNGDGLKYEFDVSATKIRIFYPTQELNVNINRAGAEMTASSSAPAATVLEVRAIGY